MKEADYKEWMAYAESDLKSAELLLKVKGFPGHVIFHCHEAVEKYLKGIFVKQSLDFHRIHKLRTLVDDAPISDEDKLQLDNTFLILDSLYLFSRYPDMGEPPGVMEAKSAYDRTLKSVEILKKYLSV